MRLNNNKQAFFELMKAGLWEKSVRLSPYGDIDFSEVQKLAEEQSVVGLIAAGLEHVEDRKPVKQDVIQFIAQTLQLEQQNFAMNYFIGVIIDKMRAEGIHALLVKGQGIAQCYERPLWRACGDVDLFLDEKNYQKAKSFLVPLSSSIEEEDIHRLHLGMTIDPWVVELHGTMRSAISRKLDYVIDEVQNRVFQDGEVRGWKNGDTEVFLPSADNDIVLVFTHFIKHFYVGGIGLRQICDWCRLLWTYRDSLNLGLLESRIREARLMTEWKAFASFAIIWLGMPKEAMPFHENSKIYKTKANRICNLILEAGDFGHNKDDSYRSRYSGLVSIVITFCRRLGEFSKVMTVFPGNAPKFFVGYVFSRFA